MKRSELVDTFVELGRRLENFGCNDRTRQLMARAGEINGWFRPGDMVAAVGAVRDDMLRREALEEWLSHYEVPVAEPRKVGVIMAGNIPLVGFLDMMCVLVSGHECYFKPSAKDTVLMEYVAELLLDIAPGLPLRRLAEDVALDAVIATGSDNTNRYFRSRYGAIPSLLRGSRASLAVLSGRESDDELRALAEDIFAYSGLGCRSVSLLFVPAGFDVGRIGRVVCAPREVNPKYRNNYLHTRALKAMHGQEALDCGFCLLAEERDFPMAVSCVNYSCYSDPREVKEWIESRRDHLQCVVGAAECGGEVRFGQAQHPTLHDWPDGKDVIRFLESI